VATWLKVITVRQRVEAKQAELRAAGVRAHRAQAIKAVAGEIMQPYKRLRVNPPPGAGAYVEESIRDFLKGRAIAKSLVAWDRYSEELKKKAGRRRGPPIFEWPIE